MSKNNTRDEGLLEPVYGLSQFPEKHMFGAQGALGKNPMKDGILNPNELQGLDPEQKIKPSYNQTKTNTTSYANESKMVNRTESGLVVPKTDEDVDHNIEIYKTDKIDKIQDQLDFCNNIQSLYIDKHEELKTVFALTLNLFQFYSYSLNVIEKLIKAYEAKEEKNIFSIQSEHTYYLPKDSSGNVNVAGLVPLYINFYASQDAIFDNIKVELRQIKGNISEDDKKLFLNCLRFEGNDGKKDVDTSNNSSSLTFKNGDRTKIIFDLQQLSVKETLYTNLVQPLSNEDLKPVQIVYLSGENFKLIINIATNTTTSLFAPETPAQFVPSSFTNPPPSSSPGGVVHFKKFSNIDKLKDHQKALKKQLQELHKVIIEGPEMTTNTSSGKLPIQGGAKKKKTTESININEAINDLIGGTVIPEATIFNYHQNEIVEKETGTGNYYFVDIEGDFESLEAKNVLNLKRTNSSNNTITFTKLKEAYGDKFEKDTNVSITTFEENNGFENKDKGGDQINKFKKLEHSKMIELLGDVKNPLIDLNKPIVFDSEFYTSEVYKSLFTFNL